MLKWLLPHEGDFYSYFEKHISITIKAAQELLSLVSGNKDIPSAAQHILEFEHQADFVTHTCVEELHKTFITPFQREDIHRLISKMDDIIDYIKDTANCIKMYKVEDIKEDAKQLAEILLSSTKLIETALLKLRKLNDINEVKDYFIDIHQLENCGDAIYLSAVGRLFDEEENTRMIIKWKEIYENLENAIDCCEDVANVIEGVILESK